MCWRLFIAMNLNDTDFELFAVPATFAQDRAALDARWKELQREAHPDRFAARGAAAQRVAMQWSVRINEAYQRLKNPIKRATYLCDLNGAPINAENNTAMPSDFLMQQIEHQEHQLAFVRRARAHLRHKAVEMRCPARIDQAEFAVENCRLRGQLAEGLQHAGQPGRGFPLLEYMRTPAPSLMTWKRKPSHLGS